LGKLFRSFDRNGIVWLGLAFIVQRWAWWPDNVASPRAGKASIFERPHGFFSLRELQPFFAISSRTASTSMVSRAIVLKQAIQIIPGLRAVRVGLVFGLPSLRRYAPAASLSSRSLSLRAVPTAEPAKTVMVAAEL
jgi:hypothetical protein